ncbi:hypothetical protein P171DRAFT_240436 [Karstenula rhodostoma CBS 690.94]|uniref:Uncharacterized protein n=1 Tax=Karstenula rhodostoma CBS 690.94 TaxID=1392251 RepID=A0A9P4PPY8_9PLEO|nr:hypothetical protein P171DRAFT_240436 [Karstenula rhodostoma CBS 690.94]
MRVRIECSHAGVGHVLRDRSKPTRGTCALVQEVNGIAASDSSMFTPPSRLRWKKYDVRPWRSYPAFSPASDLAPGYTTHFPRVLRPGALFSFGSSAAATAALDASYLRPCQVAAESRERNASGAAVRGRRFFPAPGRRRACATSSAGICVPGAGLWHFLLLSAVHPSCV